MGHTGLTPRLNHHCTSLGHKAELREQEKELKREEIHDHLPTDNQYSSLIAEGVGKGKRMQGTSLGPSCLRAGGLQEQEGSPCEIPQS